LRAIRVELAANRLTTALFDSRRFARHLESAFETMWRMHLAGLPPRPFAVARIG
jgi:predicted O-linked N-acetylglucosamine transferase (SPINDLY family)